MFITEFVALHVLKQYRSPYSYKSITCWVKDMKAFNVMEENGCFEGFCPPILLTINNIWMFSIESKSNQ